jgi:hypothetical protein
LQPVNLCAVDKGFCAYFQRQVTKLREVEKNPDNYRASVGGYLAELDRMNLVIREYLWLHPSEINEHPVSA